MQSLFEMMMQAQNGAATDMMAKQFGLDQAQVEKAMAALMPAFSQGLKRKTADPTGLSEWMENIAGGQHTDYFDDITKAFAPQGVNAGNDVLGQLFGSKDLSRAVATQAAQATGIGQQILKQMLPVIASAIMGGMHKQMTGQLQAANAPQGNVFGQVIEQMMRNAGAQAPAPVERNPNPLDNPLGKALEQMFGNGTRSAPTPTPDTRNIPNPMDMDNNPWGKILKEMMQGTQPGAQPRTQQSAPRTPAPAPAPQRSPYEDLFGDMFEAGRKSQEQMTDGYQKSIESVFDNYLRGMDRLNGR